MSIKMWPDGQNSGAPHGPSVDHTGLSSGTRCCHLPQSKATLLLASFRNTWGWKLAAPSKASWWLHYKGIVFPLVDK